MPIIFDTFGPLPQATFGGTGIPNDEVAAGSSFVSGDTTIVVALSATQRFSENPPLTSDNAGTFFATPGSNTPASDPNGLLGATWNFNFYIEVDNPNDPTLSVDDFEVDLFYDFDPAPNTVLADLGRIDIDSGTAAAVLSGDIAPNPTVVQGSQNALFGFLQNDIPGFVDAPPLAPFDPSALGEYTFALQISGGGFAIETVSMKVVVPEPTAALALLAGPGLFVRRRVLG
ncbi:MAG: hypothetical protein AAGF84_04130 [Planctomycetota bacterium]